MSLPVRGRDPTRTPPPSPWTWACDSSWSRLGRGTSCTREQTVGSAGRHERVARTQRGRGPDESSRQTSAALGPPVLEHGTTGAGAHAGTKPVLLGPAMGVGLECALHDVLLRPPAGHTGAGDHDRWPRCWCTATAECRCSTARPRARPCSRVTWQGYGRARSRGNQDGALITAADHGPLHRHHTRQQAAHARPVTRTSGFLGARRACYGAAPARAQWACPHLWTSVWTP